MNPQPQLATPWRIPETRIPLGPSGDAVVVSGQVDPDDTPVVWLYLCPAGRLVPLALCVDARAAAPGLRQLADLLDEIATLHGAPRQDGRP